MTTGWCSTRSPRHPPDRCRRPRQSPRRNKFPGEIAMLRKVFLASLISLATVVAMLAQDSPPASQATDFKGVTLKNRAPISNEVLKVKFAKPAESKLKN